MANVTFNGIASGIDTGSLITAMVNQAKIPMNQLAQQKSDYSSLSTKLSNIKTKLTTLQDSVKALDTKNEALGNKVSSSETDVLTASGTGGAAMGSFKLEVTSIAKAERDYSAGFSSSSQAGLVGTGTLSIQVGTGDAVDIDVTADDTLSTIAQKINSSGADVSAGMFYDGTSYRLQVTGKKTGTANAVTFSESSGLSLGLSAADAEKQAASDAVVVVDGLTELTVTSSTNTITGAVPGVTLNVVDTGTSTVTVDRDGDALNTKLDTFIKAYNDVMTTLNGEFAYVGVAKGPSSLNGDGSMLSLQASLRSMIATAVDNGGSALSTLASIGVSTQRDGTLSLDDTKFDEAVASDYDGVASLLAGKVDGQGIMGQLSGSLDQYTRTDGILRSKIDGIAARNRSIDTQLSNMQTRLDQYQEQLERKYTLLEQTIGGLQSQSSALSSIVSSM